MRNPNRLVLRFRRGSLPIAFCSLALLASQAQAQSLNCDAPDEVLHEFVPTGGTQTLTVPARVYGVRVSLYGAGGGNGGGFASDPGDSGGAGGRMLGLLAVQPGDSLAVVVGAAGQSGDDGAPFGNGGGGQGGHGYRTGGDGGNGGDSDDGIGGGGGGGGGSTALLRNGTLVAHAAGGGGGGAEGGQGDAGTGGSFGVIGGDGNDGTTALGGQGGDGGNASVTNKHGQSTRGGGGGGGGAGRYFGDGADGGLVQTFSGGSFTTGGGGGGGAGSAFVAGLTTVTQGTANAETSLARLCLGAPKYSIGGNASGNTGSVTLRLTASGEATQNLVVATGPTGFTFQNLVTPGATWAVSIVSAPAGQTLTVVPDRGTMGKADITFLQLRPVRVCRVTSSGTFGASDGRNGNNWTDQAKTLHGALADVGCTEIWVRAGVYAPTTNTGLEHSFRITRNLKLYGGFAGTETTLAERLPDPANRSILSGDKQGDDDSGNADGNFITEDASEIVGSNAWVLNLDGTTANGSITPSTVIDGFVITGGNANGTQQDGGGLFCDGQASDRTCNPTLQNLSFIGNRANDNGGAIFNLATTPRGASSPVLSNVTFSGNVAVDRGGAMYNDGRNGGNSSPTLSHVTIHGNSASQSSGALYNDADNTGTSNPNLNHVILWNNGSGGIARRDNAVATLRYTLVQGGCAAVAGANCGNPATNLAVDPLLGALADNGGLTPTFLPSLGSPVIDAGHATSCAGLDQRGSARPQDGDGNGNVFCDIGAVEIDAPGRSLSVAIAGNGLGEVSADPVPVPSSGEILDCGAGGTCSANYGAGSQVSLMATANAADSEFSGWGSDCSSAGSAAIALVLLDADKTCEASFALKKYDVSTSVAGSGSLDPPNASVEHGSTAQFAVTPSVGWDLDAIDGCAGSLIGDTYTTGAITAACTVNASFVLVPLGDVIFADGFEP